jgi:hypothetical protein
MDQRAALIGEVFSPVGECRKQVGENGLPILPGCDDGCGREVLWSYGGKFNEH